MEFKPPSDLLMSGNLAENWKKWKQQFELFMEASEKSAKPSKQKVAILLNILGEEALEVYNTFIFDNESDIENYEKVIQKFEEYCLPRSNVVFDRYKFFTRSQNEGEKIDAFVVDLKKLASVCNFGEQKDSLIRDRLVLGVCDRKLQERLLREQDLTLEKAVEFLRANETSKEQMKTLQGNSIQEVYKKENDKNYPKQKRSMTNVQLKKPAKDTEWKCARCGQSHKPRSCPAWGRKCKSCGKNNHFAQFCKSNSKVNSVQATPDVTVEKTAFLGSMETENMTSEQSWEKTIIVGDNTKISFKLDSGADVSVIPEDNVFVKKSKTVKSDTKLFGPGKCELKCTGMIRSVKLTYGESSILQNLYVIRGLNKPLLGRPAIEQLKLIQIVQEVTKSEVQPANEFPNLFQGLGTFPGEEYEIELRPDAKPFSITAPRTVPVPLLKKVEAELIAMVHQGVISPVEKPTEWCHPMVVVRKPTGDVRICVDYTHLNRSVKREVHPLPKVEHTLARLANAKIFSKLDANSGFWQVPLSKKSAPLTTFITPVGRFQFNRLPFGITSVPEHFQRRMSALSQGMPGVVCHMDDVLIWGATSEEHDARLREVLKKMSESGITLNKAKSQFGVKEVKYLGHVINEKGVQADPKKVEAVVHMKPPTNKEELQRFLGMLTFLGSYIPDKSTVLEPLNSLLMKNTQWIWDTPQKTAFTVVKSALSTAPVLALYDPEKKTIISADASSYGLGAVIMQKQDDGSTRPVAYASRTMSAAEKRYAQIEREALALTWACNRFRDYVTGLHFTLETDHKPLVSILTTKNIDDLSPKLQRFRMHMMRYSYEVVHIPGKQLVTADVLSRRPLDHDMDAEAEELMEETEAFVHMIVQYLPCTDRRLQEIKQHQENDPTCQILKLYAATGWPMDRQKVPIEIRPYWTHRAEITEQDGILMRACRIIIPRDMQRDIKEKIHEGHLGIVKCRERARQSCWWPGISNEIEDLVTSCPECMRERKNRNEPLIPSSLPARPWQKIALDIFKCSGHWYVLITDYFSRFPEVKILNNQRASTIIEIMKDVFARFGIPEEVRSDSGPQFQVLESTEFASFAKEYGFRHVRSSPSFPQANGFVEAGVKIAKQRIIKSDDLSRALLAYRSTPLENGFSPAELLMGRKIRTTLPVAPSELVPLGVAANSTLRRKEERLKQRQERNYNRRHGVRGLRELKEGQKVWIIDTKKYGWILKKADQPRSYIVQTQSGQTLQRNRFHLVPSFS